MVVLKYLTRRPQGQYAENRKLIFLRIWPLAVAFVIVVATCCPAEEPIATLVFQSGTEGYDTFRIPATIRTPSRLLAFCEGRLTGSGDSGEIDLVLKHSEDGGTLWSPLAVVVHDPGFTCGNPAPVYVADSGEVVLLWTRNGAMASEERILKGNDPPRTVWVTRSKDEGATWSAAIEITATASRPEWRWYATGPCHGIQLESGRLLIPANHSLGPDQRDWYSHAIYSDDQGKTWSIGGVHQGYTNESAVAELADGRVYQNMRSYTGEHCRRVAYSADGGLTWSEDQSDPALVEPVCQGSVLSDSASPLLLFSNPASTKREKMTVRGSVDGGATWPVSMSLYGGPSAYSDLVRIDDENVGCLYERGEKSPYESIVFTRFPLSRFMPGLDR